MIINLMLGRKRGGLEQAAIDYAHALTLAHIPLLTVIAPGAWAQAPLVAAGIAHETLSNCGQWDILAAVRLCRLATKYQARAIICHGNRALTFALRAVGGRIPVIAVAHNYSTRRCTHADACFTVTQHLIDHLRKTGATNITYIPNAVRESLTAPHAAMRTPPIIGAMGRFIARKGFQHYIEALAILRTRGIAFRAILGGDGEDSPAMDALITRYQLGEHITRTGWVMDKAAFFAALDIFVFPSTHEPFGIALIEAMAHGLPVIATDAEGPREIIENDINGLLAPRRNPEALADAMARLLTDPALAQRLATTGQMHVNQHYTLHTMAQRLQTALAPYI